MTLPVLVIFGPTASGKTALLERFFAEKQLRAEVVSADSMQVYRGMDIGTAKPDSTLRSRLPHHLIDIRSPDQTFDVGDFVRLADAACVSIHERGRLPVVCGGTGFYLKHFVAGLPEVPPSDAAVRETVRAEAARFGTMRLFEELSRVDPASAARIHPHDTYRVSRAVEVHRATGKPLSEYAACSRVGRPEFRFICLSLERDREELYRRINERTASMFAAGLPEEVRALIAAGYGAQSPGMRAIGYREFFEIEGDWTRRKLAAVEDAIAQNTRRYAKRQIVFAASIPGLRAVRMDADQELADALRSLPVE